MSSAAFAHDSSTHETFKSKPSSATLRVNTPGDTYEQEADQVADKLGRGERISPWSLSSIGLGHVQRQDGPGDQTGTPPKPLTTDDMIKKVGEALLETKEGKAAVKAIKKDPLVKSTTDFLSTPAGIVITGVAATGVVSGLAAAHKPLPMQIPKLPLDFIHPGLGVQLKYEGPVNHPTAASITLSFTPGGGKKKDDEKANIAADIARLRAEQEMFRDKSQDAQEVSSVAAAQKLTPQQPAPPAPPVPDVITGADPAASRVAASQQAAAPHSDSSAKAEDKKREENVVQRKAQSTQDPGVTHARVVEDALRGSGRPLDPDTRRFMETRIGFDLRKVRVFTDTGAADSARNLNAEAYTTGNNIVFDSGKYEPHSAVGRKLLAHELAHVVQQNRSPLQHGSGQSAARASSLRIGPAHDSFEQEADHAAEKIMSGGDRHVAWSLSRVGLGPVQRQCSCGGSCDDCKKKKELLQRNATSSAELSNHAPASVSNTLSRPGSSLDPGTRSFMESRFGHDFSSVRIHTDTQAAESARDVNAAAYTVGNQIVFGSGFFAPESTPGRILLAHELAHVVQQGAGRSLYSAVNRASEHEALLAGQAIGRNAVRLPIRESSGVGIAAMTVDEARRKLWGYVPDEIKEQVRPAVRQVAAQMDKVIPPNTEIPKPIENVVLHPVDTAISAVEHPIEAAQTVAKTVETAKPIVKKAAAKVVPIVKAKVMKSVHDKLLETAGQAKGVVLEGAQIVDTVAWGSQKVHELEQKALGNSIPAKMLIFAIDPVNSTTSDALNELAKAGLSSKPHKEGEPAGPFEISNVVSAGIDKYVGDPIEKSLGDGKPEQGLMFTSYEMGELEGAIGTQVALAFVGAEEVQLGLKVLGAIGGVKGLVDSIDKNPQGWKTDPNFWAAFIGLALGILGLGASRSAGKITKILLTGGALIPIIPLVYNLYKHYTTMADGPEKDKALKADAGAIVKAVAAAIQAMVHAGGAKGAGAEQEPGSAPGKQPAQTAAPVQEEPAAAKTTAPPAIEKEVAAPAQPSPTEHAATVPAKATAPATEPMPDHSAIAPAHEQTAAPQEAPPPAKTKSSAPGEADKPAASGKQMEPENQASPKAISKEKAVATEEIEVPGEKEKHEIVGSEEGLGRCSPNCPAIPIAYAKELAERPDFADRYKKIRALGETDIKAATKEAAKLARDIEKYKQAAALQAGKPKTDLPAEIAAAEAELNDARKATVDYKAQREEAGKSLKGGPIKGIWNAKEKLWILKRQQAYPDRTILEQARIVGVKRADGSLQPMSEISATGRTPDYVELRGNKVVAGDLKSAKELLSGIEGGVKSGKIEAEIREASKLGGQHKVEEKVVETARKDSGSIVLQGRNVMTGEVQTIVIPVADYRSEVVTYEDVRPN